MKTISQDTVHRAACGDRQALAELRQDNPQMEFKKGFDDLRGPKVLCRRKGTKTWKTL